MNPLLRKKEVRFIISGVSFESACPHAVLEKLNLGHAESSMPTIGCEVKTVKYNCITFDSWIIGYNGVKMRPLIMHLVLRPTHAQLHGMLFVVDCADEHNLPWSVDELRWILEADEFEDVPLLFLAHGHDARGARPLAEVEREIGGVIRGQKWHIQPVNLTSGQGLKEGLEWLVQSALEYDDEHSSTCTIQ